MERPLLFAECPALRNRVQWSELGEYPTPVEKLEGLCRSEGIRELYIKRDDLSSPHYGGNKVRKLEYLLALAVSRGHKATITFGAAGSNHVLATVIHARRVGIRTIAVLVPQPNAAYVRKNLLLDYVHGAQFVLARSVATVPLAFAKGMIAGYDRENRMFPFIIPPGGTSLPGCLGYVDAALEIRRQVDEGLLPEPEFIFVTYGSGGTAAGLIVGAQLTGLRGRVIPVRVVEKVACNRLHLAWHVNRTVRFLKRNCPTATVWGVRPGDITLIDNFAGKHYARFTEEGMDAVDKARALDGVKLEGTYTGKTLAAALDFIKTHGTGERPALFLNTYSSADLYPTVADIDYHLLPPALHRYFTSPLQEEKMGHEVVY